MIESNPRESGVNTVVLTLNHRRSSSNIKLFLEEKEGGTVSKRLGITKTSSVRGGESKIRARGSVGSDIPKTIDRPRNGQSGVRKSKRPRKRFAKTLAYLKRKEKKEGEWGMEGVRYNKRQRKR